MPLALFLILPGVLFVCRWIAFGAVITATPALSAAAKPPQATMDCGNGPLNRSFGGSPWLVYACGDSRSVVLMSAPGSKAMPFYFMFSWENGAYRLIASVDTGRHACNRVVVIGKQNALHGLTPVEEIL